MFLRADSELQCLCEAQSWLHGLKLNFLPMSPHVLLEVREGISIDIIQQSCLSPAAPLEQRETLH